MNDERHTMIDAARNDDRDMKHVLMDELGLDEDDAYFAMGTLDASPLEVSAAVWAQAWGAARADWPHGEQTGERLAALVLQYAELAAATPERSVGHE